MTKQKKKILIVEDERKLSHILKLLLESDGFTVICSYSGYEGLYKYVRERPDLIILDIMLPDLDGYEVCREIRRTLNNLKTPIIMLTCKGEDYDRVKGKVVGATKYMLKPYDGENLLNQIRECLEQSTRGLTAGPEPERFRAGQAGV